MKNINKKEMQVSYDIFDAMKKVIIKANLVSKFKSINKTDIFKMEYWPLERAKLNNQNTKNGRSSRTEYVWRN